MLEEYGEVRVLLATEAYGYGADSPNVRYIIHVGPPNTMESKLNILFFLNNTAKQEDQNNRKIRPIFLILQQDTLHVIISYMLVNQT